LPRLHLITDDAVLLSPGFVERARAVVTAHGAGVALHLRGHGLSGGELFRLAEPLAAACAEAGATFLVNDRVDVALAVGALGVQLGRRSLPIAAVRPLVGPAVRIGYSAHDADEARDAASSGADHVLVGTIYASASHPGEPGAGVERVRATAELAGVPVIAIGGITPARVAEVVAAGAAGVAVLGGIWHEPDPVAAADRYLRALEEVCR